MVFLVFLALLRNWSREPDVIYSVMKTSWIEKEATAARLVGRSKLYGHLHSHPVLLLLHLVVPEVYEVYNVVVLADREMYRYTYMYM